MKKNRLVLMSIILALAGITGCNKNVVDELANDMAVTSVSLSHSYATVEAGETLQLSSTIKYQDEKEYSCYKEWRTSNPKLATVSEEGLVSALKPGSVSITFIAGYKSAACSITIPDHSSLTPIVPDDPSTPEGGGSTTFSISLNAESINIVLDEHHEHYYQLEAITSAQASITWSSDNESVATVDQNGLVIAQSEGEAVITASANGKTATCDVSVLLEPEEDPKESELMTVHVYFFIDYNNVDENDTTGKKLLAKFWWFDDEEHPLSSSGKVPANPTTPPIAAFPYFAGWSIHPLIDSKSELLDLSNGEAYAEAAQGRSFLYIYGIWTDVPGGMQL